MEGQSGFTNTASLSTSQNEATFARILSSISWSERHTMMSGETPRLRSSFTECCVGFVFTSCEAEMYGTSDTWM